MPRVFLLAGVALAMLCTPALAGQDLARELKDAQKALAAGEYEQAYAAYLEHADDNPLAQFTLALFHQNGWGRPADREAACVWHGKAAEGGIPASQHQFGDCLREGVGRPADPTAAAGWYRKAGDSGHFLSYCSLAELYMAGQGVDRAPEKALALCRQAAEKHSGPSQMILARLYRDGDPSVRDPAAAYHWFEVAAQGGSAAAQYQLGVMSRDGVGVEASPELARHWFEQAAAQGHLPAYFPTARLYFEVPPEADTGKPEATILAKSYLWLAATAKRATDPDQLAETQKMLAEVRKIMPETWVADLDAKVAKHLEQHAAGGAAEAPR